MISNKNIGRPKCPEEAKQIIKKYVKEKKANTMKRIYDKAKTFDGLMKTTRINKREIDILKDCINHSTSRYSDSEEVKLIMQKLERKLNFVKEFKKES